MLARLVPHPLLTLSLVVVWLALVNKVTLGNVILGAGFGLVIPMLTRAYWPDRPRVRNPRMMIEFTLIVLWDIVVANVQVAMILLFRPEARINSVWITVPVDLTSVEAITVLAGTITMTPGTVSATLSADGAAILVHTLDTDDPDSVRDQIKTRYERRLKEIFE
jgi:multicomponent K+:H+ antiporter subunit E